MGPWVCSLELKLFGSKCSVQGLEFKVLNLRFSVDSAGVYQGYLSGDFEGMEWIHTVI